jgi:hypothetical protein
LCSKGFKKKMPDAEGAEVTQKTQKKTGKKVFLRSWVATFSRSVQYTWLPIFYRCTAAKPGNAMPEVFEVIPQTNESQASSAYAPDDGSLPDRQISALRREVAQHLPKGELLSQRDLFVPFEQSH